MNLYRKINNNEVELFKNAGIRIEDKDYEQEELKRMEQQIIDYIMSASSKNGEIDKRRNQYDSIFKMIVK